MTDPDLTRIRDLLGEYFEGYVLIGFPIDNPTGSAYIRQGLHRDDLERMATHLEVKRRMIIDYLFELENNDKR